MNAPVDEEKARLLRRLDDSRRRTVSVLEDCDPFQLVNEDAGWRVKDVLVHLTHWESEVARSIYAFIGGREYRIPDLADEDEHNDRIFRLHREDPYEDIQADWNAARADLKAAIRALPSERFDGIIMCPWGLTSAIEGIVSDMIDHELEHLRAIQSVA